MAEETAAPLTDETAAAVRLAVERLRKQAAPFGSMHSNWDVIGSAEMLLRDESHWPWDSVEEAVAKVIQYGEEAAE